MESNKVEARRAMEVAERKLSRNDYVGAKKFAEKAKKLYPRLEGLKQVLMMLNVYISASNNGGRGADWYGILGVDSLADDETVKKQYKKLALLIHPDKNKFHGAEEAFKLVLEAWCVLSDKDKRSAYDQKRKAAKQVKQKSSWKRQQQKKEPEQDWNQYAEEGMRSSSCPEIVRKFWTACERCRTYCGFETTNFLNKNLSCPNCGQDFVATEIAPEMVDGRSVFRFGIRRKSE